MKTYYSPGCALMINKLGLARKILEALSKKFGVTEEWHRQVDAYASAQLDK